VLSPSFENKGLGSRKSGASTNFFSNAKQIQRACGARARRSRCAAYPPPRPGAQRHGPEISVPEAARCRDTGLRPAPMGAPPRGGAARAKASAFGAQDRPALRARSKRPYRRAARHAPRPEKPPAHPCYCGRAALPASAAPVALRALCHVGPRPGALRESVRTAAPVRKYPPCPPGWARGARGHFFSGQSQRHVRIFHAQAAPPPRPAPRRGARKQLREAAL